MAYSPTVLDHFERPRNVGDRAGASGEWIRGAAGERSRGAEIDFDLQVEAGRIVQARFRAYGCPHTIAAASWVTEWLRGRPLGAVAEVRAGALAERLALPAEKLGRLLVVEDALAACLTAWQEAGHTEESS